MNGRFSPPWSVEEQKARFAVRSSTTGSSLHYVYFEDGPSRRSAAKLLTRDKARRGREKASGRSGSATNGS